MGCSEEKYYYFFGDLKQKIKENTTHPDERSNPKKSPETWLVADDRRIFCHIEAPIEGHEVPNPHTSEPQTPIHLSPKPPYI